MQVAKKYVDQANEFAAQDNQKGLETLKNKGVEFVSFKKEDLEKAESMRINAIDILIKDFFTPKVMDPIQKYRL